MFFRFRFRSPQRDKGTDQARLLSIRHAVRSAISSADSELRGLQARLENARQAAASLLGNDVDGSDREPDHEAELRTAEERLLGAERRIGELKGHLGALRRIEDSVNVEGEAKAARDPLGPRSERC
jgi:chromosome segregation ATPase